MNYFDYQGDKLFCEQMAIEEVATKFGSPVYIYSYQALKDQYAALTRAFAPVDHLICYAMKANSNAAILKTFLNEGSGIDVVTGGELSRALDAGCPGGRIVFSGVGKSDEEIKLALNAKILQFNVESEEELKVIAGLAKTMNKRAPVALRTNPDVDPQTHPYIATGFKKSKFGIHHERVLEIYREIKDHPHLETVGIDCHIGSQLTSVAPFVEAMRRIKNLMVAIRQAEIHLKHLDFGGGLGIVYNKETPPSAQGYASALISEMKDMGVKLILEPGRFLVGNAGILVTRVTYHKKGIVKNFVIVDAASNDLMRPALYDAYHHIQPVHRDPARPSLVADVVGPVCESGDFFAHDRPLPLVHRGELLALMSAGAYGFSMASQYNSRPRAAEVMVKGNEAFLVRERERLEDVVRGEHIPSFLK